MTYDVRFTGPVRRALRGIPPRIVPAIIEFAFGDLAREPRRVGKPLGRDLVGLFGARRGPYRLLYRVDEEAQTVHVVHLDHRADVYRPRWAQRGYLPPDLTRHNDRMHLRPYDATTDAEPVLALNQANLDAVGRLDAQRLAWLVDIADSVLVGEDDGALAGFVVLIGPDGPYDSINYRWYAKTLPTFLYLDRVVVAPSHRRRGVGTQLYDAAEARAVPYGVMALEVYAVPPNEGSLAFHAARGYVELDRLEQANGKTAAMLVKRFTG